MRICAWQMLTQELKDMGAQEVVYDEAHCCVYAKLPANAKECESWPILGFIAHMDTSPDLSGEGVNPKLVPNYDGSDICLGSEDGQEYILSPDEFPELWQHKGKTLITTDGTTLLGADDKAVRHYIIRDHDRERFEQRKALLQQIVGNMNKQCGTTRGLLEMKDSYCNMKEKLADAGFLIDNAEKLMKDMGIVPKIQPIRGGTDGAMLSYRGLPCPNLCTGGANYHGRYEYCVAEDMESIAELLVKLSQYGKLGA